tara:strand:- start:398 stop:1336 length:939 start_codon:yes stop_codon:yes gene_type:complete
MFVEMNGIIIKSTGSWYIVKSDDGNLFKCRLIGRFRNDNFKSTNPIVVGDNVKIQKRNDNFVITELYERKNAIIRKSVNLSKQTHVIAANIDQAILMITLDSPVTTTNFIDRYLVSANAFGVDVVLLFNKLDLHNEKSKNKHEMLVSVYSEIGYKCISTSVTQGDLFQIKNIMKSKINLISGHSGVGKSTLINSLQEGLNIATNDISDRNNQGQHTTTFSELYELNFGASLIDTPGIRGFGLVEIKKNEIANYFPEFFNLKGNCKFNNCIHLNEPSCEIKRAVKGGQIAKSRYSSYLSMLDEDEENFRTIGY